MIFKGKKRTRETEQPVLVKIALNNPKIALNNNKKSIKNESAFGLQGDPGVKIRTFSPKFGLKRDPWGLGWAIYNARSPKKATPGAWGGLYTMQETQNSLKIKLK